VLLSIKKPNKMADTGHWALALTGKFILFLLNSLNSLLRGLWHMTKQMLIINASSLICQTHTSNKCSKSANASDTLPHKTVSFNMFNHVRSCSIWFISLFFMYLQLYSGFPVGLLLVYKIFVIYLFSTCSVSKHILSQILHSSV